MRLSGLNCRHWNIRSKACADAPVKTSVSDICLVGGMDSSIVPANGDLIDWMSSGEVLPVDSNIFSS